MTARTHIWFFIVLIDDGTKLAEEQLSARKARLESILRAVAGIGISVDRP
jgi:ATP-dependent DNA ligase